MSEEFSLEDLRVIRLVSNETIIGFYTANEDVVEESAELGEYLILHYPYRISEEVLQDKTNIHLQQWMPYVLDEAFILRRENIVAIGFPDAEMESCYADAIGFDVEYEEMSDEEEYEFEDEDEWE